MAQRTPWQAGKNPPGQVDPPNPSARGAPRRRVEVRSTMAALRPHLARLRGNWGYLAAAAGSLILFFTLFQPWVNASGLDGRVKATPFGKWQISSSLVALWSGAPPPQAKINGTWAVLACVAIAVTLFAVVVNLRARTTALSHLAAGSSVATALFIVFALVHMNGKAPELRAMLGYGRPTDLGSQIGLLMRWASGNGNYPVPGLRKVSITTAGLTAWAWFAAAIAVMSAVAAIAQWVRNRPAGPIQIPLQIPLRMPIVITRPSSAPAPAPAPAPDSTPAPTPAPTPDPPK
ncbi:hypothetical protein ACLMAL_30760 [Nocardia sp. CWNU-33]|uniref:hypothetical protein n=1 Tax=Nocardia sp. CWNU-33 TaxID=3392117 RepID=UPI00398E8926